MNQDFNNQINGQNRFIFSDDFYNSLDSENQNVKQGESESFDRIVMPQVNVLSVNNGNNLNNPAINSLNSQLPEVNVPPVEYNNSSTIEENNVNSVDLGNQEIVMPQIIPTTGLETDVGNSVDTNNQVVDLQSIQLPEVNVPAFETQNDKEQTRGVLPTLLKAQELEQADKLNVESGINTELEKEILRAKVEAQSTPTIVENANYLIGPEEKVPYRAKRNNPQMKTDFYEQKEKVLEPVLNVSVKPIVDNSVNNNITVFETPQVINIDEELKKEYSQSTNIIKINDITVDDTPIIKSSLLDELKQKQEKTGNVSILAHYGDDFCSKEYITNPAIGREEEIKQLILILLTPEKSGILVGKPGIGKTSIVEGLAYRLQRNKVPEALKGYRIVSVKTTSLIGTLPNGEAKLQVLIDELKELDKIILFIDEIHMLMGATNESSLDFANMFKESLGRGSIKMIGATTNDEYERYVLRDKAFVRRFQRVDVEEPSKEHTIKILMGTLPKIEKNTGAKLKYSDFIQTEIMSFIVDITTEYKRVYGIGSRYPDICLTLLSQAFSQAVFDNRDEVNILDIRNAIENSKNIYPDVIRKELVNFDNKFKQIIEEEK